MKNENPFSIKNWSPDDQPREKMILKGAPSLSDAELIAVLIRSGSAQHSAVELAKLILNKVNNDLNQLARLMPSDLMKSKGIGEAKAVSIVAALELGRRRKEAVSEKKISLVSSQMVYDYIKGDLMDLHHEEFWAILLNRAHHPICKRRISEGGISQSVVDPKVIFRVALEERSSAIVVAHNHPSGNLQPSPEDTAITKRLKEGATLLDIKLLDHLIVAGRSYYSFNDNNLL